MNLSAISSAPPPVRWTWRICLWTSSRFSKSTAHSIHLRINSYGSYSFSILIGQNLDTKPLVINIFFKNYFVVSLFKTPSTFGEIQTNSLNIWGNSMVFIFPLFSPILSYSPSPLSLVFPLLDFWGRGAFIIYIILPEVFFLRTCILTRFRSFSLWHWIVSFHHMVVWLFRSFHLMVIGLFWSFLLVQRVAGVEIIKCNLVQIQPNSQDGSYKARVFS